MLTKEQLAKWTITDKIGLGAIERDYVQQIFLYLLYAYNSDFIFKGGTCLKFAYKLNRYSEDLDFNYNYSYKDGENILIETASKLERFGILSEIRNKRGRENQGFGFDLSYKGPLFDGRDITKSKIRIDVSLRKEEINTESILISPRYDDLNAYTIQCASLQDILAEKIRALIIRGKARDLYDIWFLLEKGEKINVDLINRKLKLYKQQFDPQKFMKIVSKENKIWKQELESLLPNVPPFEEIKNKIAQQLTIER